ncbi:MAG: L-seryl-tRNA(Sec) selenium transferase [Desulfobacteraceae bacterium]|nr:L-seryl-tRNA(Sec) selenium transferase [Desulfobacteraceae bacterium]
MNAKRRETSEPGDETRALLRRLPKMDRLLEAAASVQGAKRVPRSVTARCMREVVDDLRGRILRGWKPKPQELAEEVVLEAAAGCIRRRMRPNLRRTVNATGIIVHTNLGRSLLSRQALDNVQRIAAGYSNLEYDLAAGKRGSRYQAVEEILCEVSGAEASMVVNNNAGAVLLCLDTVARGKEVVVSRGELVEIGGAFRVPDIMSRSGCTLREVGTTNRTHLRDYAGVVGPETGLLLKVHTSNYHVIGFTASVSLQELVTLGAEHGLPVMEDLGSGTFIDFSRYGLAKEPTVQESVATGADLVTFSGDKLLGGPQGGLIVGSKEWIDRIKKNPLTRALRIDKMTLAAMESTLRLYREEEKAVAEIPTLAKLTLPVRDVERRAESLCGRLRSLNDDRISLDIVERPSKAGGGSLPMLNVPSRCVSVVVEGIGAARLEQMLRSAEIPVVGRIEEDVFLMDMRTVQEDELPVIQEAFQRLLQQTEAAS